VKRVFGDTHFYIALLSARDAAHAAARRIQREAAIREVVTTSWVLLELADAMRDPEERRVCVAFIKRLRQDPNTRVIPASEAILWRGFELYGRRLDKAWSLTDCISFAVMTDEGLGEALTGDRHFEQAGFVALLAPAD
jgi:hypothetical protein